MAPGIAHYCSATTNHAKLLLHHSALAFGRLPLLLMSVGTSEADPFGFLPAETMEAKSNSSTM